MTTATAQQAGEAPPAHDQGTLLHRAITRVAQEFMGTAEGEPSRDIITFAIPGFPDHAPRDERRRVFEQVRAAVGQELDSILKDSPSVPELVSAVTEAMEKLRTAESGAGGVRGEAYESLTDIVDAVVYYNRPPLPAKTRAAA
jgi:hypothetical protein